MKIKKHLCEFSFRWSINVLRRTLGRSEPFISNTFASSFRVSKSISHWTIVLYNQYACWEDVGKHLTWDILFRNFAFYHSQPILPWTLMVSLNSTYMYWNLIFLYLWTILENRLNLVSLIFCSKIKLYTVIFICMALSWF